MHNEVGFGLIEVIITVGVLLVISLTGFYFLHMNRQQPSQNKQPQPQHATSKATHAILADTPADLRDFIIADAKIVHPECTADLQNSGFVKTDGSAQTAQQPVILYSSNNLAHTVVGCSTSSDSSELLVKENGTWKKVDQFDTGGSYKCSTLKQYKPSLKLLGSPNGTLCSFDNNSNSNPGKYDGHTITTLNLRPPTFGQ